MPIATNDTTSSENIKYEKIPRPLAMGKSNAVAMKNCFVTMLIGVIVAAII
jgi:hypothetical protein